MNGVQPTLVTYERDNTRILSPDVISQLQLFVNPDDNALYGKDKDGNIIPIGAAVVADGGYNSKDIFTPADLQTVFVLSFAVNLLFVPILFINGAQQRILTDYTIVGNTLTWLDTNFTLSITDTIELIYTRI